MHTNTSHSDSYAAGRNLTIIKIELQKVPNWCCYPEAMKPVTFEISEMATTATFSESILLISSSRTPTLSPLRTCNKLLCFQHGNTRQKKKAMYPMPPAVACLFTKDDIAIKMQLSKCVHVEALPLPPFCGCDRYEVQIESHTEFSHCSVLKTMEKISNQSFVVL